MYLVQNLVIGYITHLGFGHLLEVQLLNIELFDLALNRFFLSHDALRCNETKDENELVEMQGWLHLLRLLLVHKWTTYWGIRVVVIIICFDQLVVAVKKVLTIGDCRKRLLKKSFKIVNIEQIWNQMLVSTKLQEGSCDQLDALLLHILPNDFLLNIVEVMVKTVNIKFP